MLWRIFERRRGDQPHVPEFAAQGTVLATECEDFLSGRLASALISERGTVPQWAWINFLAHASEPELHILAGDDYAGGLLSIYDAWRYAECSTACALLAASETSGCPVAEIQRQVLVPLELELATVNEIAPDEFEGMVFDALNHYEAR